MLERVEREPSVRLGRIVAAEIRRIAVADLMHDKRDEYGGDHQQEIGRIFKQ